MGWMNFVSILLGLAGWGLPVWGLKRWMRGRRKDLGLCCWGSGLCCGGGLGLGDAGGADHRPV